jgi:hypothetical protein
MRPPKRALRLAGSGKPPQNKRASQVFTLWIGSNVMSLETPLAVPSKPLLASKFL